MTRRLLPTLFPAMLSLAGCHHGPVGPSSPTCDHVADHVMSLLDSKNDRAKPIRDVFARRCKADAWPDEAKACMVDESSVHGGRHCKDRLPGTARESLDKELADIDAPKPPQSCVDYTRIYEALLKCDKVPEAAREKLVEMYTTTSARWTTPKSDRNGLDETCSSQSQMMTQMLTRDGCDVPPAHGSGAGSGTP
jgi:hypothetical protein|nr:hypothetical protein [Kofleriaceae bacterium]